ncbi:MAG TPA: C25 family cysteine peptidase [Pyrinomonadaceae bacterium]|jgi:hypothetical protein|nr:C25 family cysteine peptidase [Pyrinomonadaceae bacterium]
MSNLQRRVRVGIVFVSILIFLIFMVTAYAATFITQLNTPNGAPLNTNPYQFFVCSDTSFGEGPAIEYSVNGGPFTCNPCSFYTNTSTKCPGASVFQCTIPRQTSATVQYQFFNLSTFGDCGSARSLFTGFKSFTTDAGGNTTPTVAKVTDFKVVAGKGGALLEWRTGFEIDNLGFNLYREREGQRTLINPSIIAGSALTAGNGTPLTAGRSYTWRDAEGTANDLYYLESVDLSGTTSMTGPVSPAAGTIPATQQQATLLADLGSTSGQSAQREGPTTLMSAPVSQVPDGTLQDQWAIAAQPAIKINVRKTDWYHVTQADLLAAGLNPSTDASNLRLFVDGVEQAMMVKSGNGPLGSGDYIEFYGTALDKTETDTHVYWLVPGSTPGKRIKLVGNERPDSIKGDEKPAEPLPSKPPVQHKVDKDDLSGSFFWPFMQILGLRTEGTTQPAQEQPPQQRGAEESAEAPPKLDQKNEEEAATPIGLPTQGNVSETPPAQIDAPHQTGASKQIDVPVRVEAPAKPNVVEVPANPHVIARAEPATRHDEQASKLRASRKAKSRQARKRSTARRELSHYSPAAADGNAGEAQSFSYTVEIKERTIYFSSLLNGDKENFFGKVIASIPATQTLNVNHLDTNAPETVMLEVALQGVSPQPHHINVFFNDTQVGTVDYFFRDHTVVTIPLSLSQLHEGSNTLKLATVAGGDVNIVDYVRLTYPHKYQADNNTLRLSLKNNLTARVEGFTTPDIRLLDITNPSDVQQLRPTIEPSGAGYALVVGTQGRNTKGRRTLIAFPNGQVAQPASLSANQPSDLNRTNQSADLVIISHRTLKQNIAPLANLRRALGLAVTVIDVEDVYDEFSYGTHTPQAIKDFLSYTKTNWTRAPRFVLLAGDSSYDPKNYLHAGDFDLVPSKLVDTLFTETSSDDWLTDFDGDAVPDIALGRLPARTTAELDKMVTKIVNYNVNAVTKSALFVADEQGTYPFSFEEENLNIATLLPHDISVHHVNRGSNPNINVVRAQLFDGINQGPMIVNYAGHGTVDAWTGASLFTDPDALALSNGAGNSNRLPLFVMMTCLNGYYNDPTLDSLAESLMKAPNGGAVAVWASSGLTVPTGQALANQSLYQSIYGNPSLTLGEAIQRAKAATPDSDVRLTWTLFGDPSMNLR